MDKDKLIEIRNRLYDNLPKGEVSVFDFIKVIKEHLTELDLLIDSLTAPVPDGKECLHLIAYVDDDNFQRCQTCDKIID